MIYSGLKGVIGCIMENLFDSLTGETLERV